MKSYIYLGLTLLSISLLPLKSKNFCNEQGTDKGWLEEFTRRDNSMPDHDNGMSDIIVGSVGGSVGALSALALSSAILGGENDPVSIFQGTILGCFLGSTYTRYLNQNDNSIDNLRKDKYTKISIFYWTSCMATMSAYCLVKAVARIR